MLAVIAIHFSNQHPCNNFVQQQLCRTWGHYHADFAAILWRAHSSAIEIIEMIFLPSNTPA